MQKKIKMCIARNYDTTFAITFVLFIASVCIKNSNKYVLHIFFFGDGDFNKNSLRMVLLLQKLILITYSNCIAFLIEFLKLF